MTMPPATSEALHALRRGDLAGTRELRLTGGLTEFPREILGLADSLERLDLGGNALTALPDDFGRLRRLRVLFCSGNRFERLPEVLGDCEALSQIGCRGAGLREVPGTALPPRLRWLTLTDNCIAELPVALGERPELQKLMLSGNRLRSLPDGLAGADRLELLRLSCNGFVALPPWLSRLPRLAWLTYAGNPVEPASAEAETATIPWPDLAVAERLGEGASGVVHRALWRGPGREARPVAVKLFKGAMTSDGLPEREMAACLAAGPHPNLTGGLGRVAGHPGLGQALVMPLLPAEWRALAGPPSLASCSRDVYDPDLRLPVPVARRLVRAAAAAAAHLHGRGFLHGDLYAHNLLWDGGDGAAVLSDFGAACRLPQDGSRAGLERIEVRAMGVLLGEVLARLDDPAAGTGPLRALERACLRPEVDARPTMAEVLDSLDAA
ncbi:leucine-rich repeat-containing protein kinase family protein [Methylobacterium oryzihabitans]|uniref:Protein kinase n=1 Tax=Methylobacterium oryzihabitans TaxID=2499852 RepID=A0A3S2XKA3_9HYPH|nr:leucine-rich repeat-containing protein kinase family protein [Methylobacterium oryzihabitans]RVU16873.1 protein kinase [Methylobacterium oryzihabitans]